MDTTYSIFLRAINIFFVISTTIAAPGFFGLDSLLQGPRYDTHVELERVKFFHFNSSSSETNTFYDVTSDFSHLDPTLPLVVVIHGFMGSPHARSTKLLIDGYVSRGGSNVVGVNWKDLAKGPWYGVAAERSYDAAKQLADWLNEVVTANVTTWKEIHIVGFSLGAQVAGLTSKYTPNGIRVGRLTGLDPARPMFDDKKPEDHLDRDDSDFTTVVHTCGGFLAIPDPLGHVDFYPNGGENPQPPCTEELVNVLMEKYVDSPTSTISRSERGPTKLFAGLVCSHYMALALWVESLKPNNKFVATKCQSWKNYQINTCYNDVNELSEVEMGENTPLSTRGTYYFKTEVAVPYASTLNDLISDGIKEYSKIIMADPLDKDHGHGEIEEVTPEIKVMIDGSSTSDHTNAKDTEHKGDSINRIGSQNSATSLINNYARLLVLFISLVLSHH